MAIVSANGKHAITHFRVLERFGEFTFVECSLETGRTHQIRVHMTHIGHPLLGDDKYGAGSRRFAIKGQALHSASLYFDHPSTGERLTFKADMPEDMQKILRKLRIDKGNRD